MVFIFQTSHLPRLYRTFTTVSPKNKVLCFPMNQEESDSLESLKRADTQRRILLFLILKEKDINNQEVAEALGLSLNSINIGLHNLNKKGLVNRVSRGVYRYNLGPIIKSLLIKYLEAE